MGKWLGPPHDDIPRCGAKTRSGGKCGHYAMPNCQRQLKTDPLYYKNGNLKLTHLVNHCLFSPA